MPTCAPDSNLKGCLLESTGDCSHAEQSVVSAGNICMCVWCGVECLLAAGDTVANRGRHCFCGDVHSGFDESIASELCG